MDEGEQHQNGRCKDYYKAAHTPAPFGRWNVEWNLDGNAKVKLPKYTSLGFKFPARMRKCSGFHSTFHVPNGACISSMV